MATTPTSTRYLDIGGMTDLVSGIGLLPMFDRLVEYLRADFLRWNDFQKSPRTANHSLLGVIELMPISDDELFSFKFVNGHPGNPSSVGLSTVMAFGALSSVRTGWPLLVSEMTILTAIRTAATSLLAAQVMARPDSRSMAMIGNGSQSEFQVLAFYHGMGIREVRLFDIDKAATSRLRRNLRSYKCLELVECSSIAEAVKGADIVTTCTADKAFATILTQEMIEPGMHLNAVGGDCPGKTELDPRILEMAKVVVEYLPQSRIEGEIQQMGPDFLATELWEILAGHELGRDSETQVTLFDSVGFSIEDFSALRLVFDESVQRGIGKSLDLVPRMSDTKDLFGLLSEAEVGSLREASGL
jgi:ornithine cyclodeaminase